MKTTWTSGGDAQDVETIRLPGPPPETDSALIQRHYDAVWNKMRGPPAKPIDNGTEIKTTWTVGQVDEEYTGGDQAAFVEAHQVEVEAAWETEPPGE